MCGHITAYFPNTATSGGPASCRAYCPARHSLTNPTSFTPVLPHASMPLATNYVHVKINKGHIGICEDGGIPTIWMCTWWIPLISHRVSPPIHSEEPSWLLPSQELCTEELPWHLIPIFTKSKIAISLASSVCRAPSNALVLLYLWSNKRESNKCRWHLICIRLFSAWNGTGQMRCHHWSSMIKCSSLLYIATPTII